MAGTYSTDITTLSDGTTGTPTEATAYAAAGSFVSNDPDVYLQGVSAYSALSAQKSANVGNSILYNNGTAITATAGHVVSIWVLWPIPSGLATYNDAIPGAQIVVGSATGTVRTYVVDGSDTAPYGGWKFYTVDLRNAATGAITTYTGTTPQYIGIAYYIITAFNRAVLFSLDTVRYGRMTMTATGGTSTSVNHVSPLISTAANFPQMADYNDYNGGGTPSFGAAKDGGYHRFGQCQDVDGGYLLRGIISIGTTATSVYFDDANRNLLINDEYLTYDDFNRIEVRSASSIVKLNSCNFSFVPRSDIILSADAPATPRGNFEMIDNAFVEIIGCTFTDMGTFTFLQGATDSSVSATTFRRCQTVLPNSMKMTDVLFVNTQSTVGAIQYDSVADGENITFCQFENNTVGPAIKITAAGTYNFNGHQFTNNTVDVEFTGTGTCTIVPANGSNVTQAKVTATGGGTITVQAASYNFDITNVAANTEIRILRQSDLLELGGAEDVGNTTPGTSNTSISTDPVNTGRYIVTYTYPYTSDTPIYVVAHSLSYQWLRSKATLIADNSSLQISQIADRQYLNP